MSTMLFFLSMVIFLLTGKAYQVTKPTKFYVDKRNYGAILPASLPIVFRLGTGALISGYKVSIEPETEANKDKYTFLSALGYRISEGTKSNFKNRPKKTLEIYEFEGCPFCRKVREAISVLDLDVIYYPCPQGGPNYRQKVSNKYISY